MPTPVPLSRPPRRAPARAAVLLALLGASCSSASDGWLARGMNVLLITVDTTRADALSCYGGDPRNTPNIDALARSGTLFENAYSATNVTKPSHLSIMTGQRAIEHRVFNNQVLIPPEVEPLPLLFQEAGYATAGFVAAIQLGEQTAWRGFDVIEGPERNREQRRGEDIVTRALGWVRKHREEPFFLWTHFFDAHTLYTPPAELARRYYQGDPRAGDGPLIGEHPFFAKWDYKAMQRWIAGIRDPAYPLAMYAAEVHYMDRQIGRLLDRMEEMGLAEETVVVLVADHGESLGEHELFYDHLGLFDVSLRIPLIVRVPGLEGGRRVPEPVTQLDIVPTLADLFGIRPRHATAGVSLRPVLEDGDVRELAERDFLIFESAHNHQIAVRRGRWKLIWTVQENSARLPREPQLFDLEADPGETRNLYDEHPEVVADLEPRIEPWIELGTLRKGQMPEMSAEILESLEDLGYAGE